MEADEKEGKLLELSVVQQTCGNICTAFTARLANFGDGLASICHNQPGDFVAGRVAFLLKKSVRLTHRMDKPPSRSRTPRHLCRSECAGRRSPVLSGKRRGVGAGGGWPPSELAEQFACPVRD